MANSRKTELPDFLSSGPAVAPNADADVPTDAEPMDETDAPDAGKDDQEPLADLMAETTGTTGGEEPANAARPRQRQRPATAAGAGMFGLFGVVALLAAAALGWLQASGTAPAALTAVGIDAAFCAIVGLVAFAAAAIRRQVARSMQQLDGAVAEQGDAFHELRSGLGYLVESHSEREPIAGQEVQHVLIAVQRQDEKINNLTKALKMYGKPLMEISTQTADIAAALTQLRGHLETAAKTAREQNEALSREIGELPNQAAIENLQRTQLQSFGRELGKEFAQQLQQNQQKLLEAVQQAMTGILHRMPNMDALQQQLTRTEAQVAAVAQRLDDSEVRKSLLRLEENTQKQYQQLSSAMPKPEAWSQVNKHTDERVADAVQNLSRGLKEMQNGNLGTLENAVREIQREVAGIATNMSQLQQVVRSGGGRAAVAAAAPAPAPAQAQAHAASPAPAPTASAAPAPAAGTHAAPATGGSDAEAGVAQNATGIRAANTKNVLGAIAKLKKMKS